MSSMSAVWQSSPPGSIYDYIKVASFALGPDGRIAQWSERAAELLGLTAHQAIGKDPVEAFVPPEYQETGHRAVADILDGREWTGLVPYRSPRSPSGHGIAEVYVMPAQDENGKRSALCIAVDVSALRGLETDLASSQAVFGQSPLGFSSSGPTCGCSGSMSVLRRFSAAPPRNTAG